jgi:hypothetical protein
MRTIFTPTEFGVYRISLVFLVTVGNGQQANYWGPTVRWQDGAGKDLYGIPVSSEYPNPGQFSVPIRDLIGKPIRFGVSSDGNVSGSKYNVFVVVEQIM